MCSLLFLFVCACLVVCSAFLVVIVLYTVLETPRSSVFACYFCCGYSHEIAVLCICGAQFAWCIVLLLLVELHAVAVCTAASGSC